MYDIATEISINRTSVTVTACHCICHCLIFLSAPSVVNRFSKKRLEKILFLSHEIAANDCILEAQLICFPRSG